jgi:cation-transporting ATPase E
MRVTETRELGVWTAAEIAAVLGAIAAADEAPNRTVRALAARYDTPPGWTVLARTPFSSARKWSGVSFAGHGTWLLGAPGVVTGANLPGDLADTIAGHEAAGHRVLLLAITAAALDGDRLPADAEPTALVVLAEELRPDAALTVRYLLDQGIEIKVLSGDAPRAAAAIARRAGIPVHGEPCDASGLSEDDDAALAEALAASSVFGRVRPGHKLAAVRALQAAGPAGTRAATAAGLRVRPGGRRGPGRYRRSHPVAKGWMATSGIAQRHGTLGPQLEAVRHDAACHLAMIDLMARRCTGESTPTWRGT